MPKYIVTRTVVFSSEQEAADPKEAYEMHLGSEFDCNDFHEEELEIWDVTDPKKHFKVKTSEWNI